MSNMKKIVSIAIAIVVVIAVAITAAMAFRDNLSIISAIDKSAADSKTIENADEIAASYKDNVITRGELEYQHQLAAYKTDKSYTEESDLDTAKRLIFGFILLEEAEKAGLSATREEVEQMVSDTKNNYNEIPEVKKYCDEYCAAAEITIDEYFKIVEEQAPATISRQKLKNHFADEYYKEHFAGEDIGTENAYEQMQKAYNSYREELLKEHADEITYYID